MACTGIIDFQHLWFIYLVTPLVSRNSCTGWGPRKWHHKGVIKTLGNGVTKKWVSVRTGPMTVNAVFTVWLAMHISSTIWQLLKGGHYIWFVMSLPVPPSGAGISAYPGWLYLKYPSMQGGAHVEICLFAIQFLGILYVIQIMLLWSKISLLNCSSWI